MVQSLSDGAYSTRSEVNSAAQLILLPNSRQSGYVQVQFGVWSR